MKYMVFDLEFNQNYDFANSGTITIKSECPFEIIDIGAVKLDDELNCIENFDELVKPMIYKRLHPFVKKLIGVSKESLKGARTFPEVFEQLAVFIKDVDVLCVWGTADIKELYRNIKFYNLDTSIIPQMHINVQSYASKYLDAPGGNSVGLANAIKLLNLPAETQFHKAYNDACYTAEIFRKINNKHIQPKPYILETETTTSNQQKKRTVLDVRKLYSQFEKMFGRPMTQEEQAIIKLAYKMGKSNQFQKKQE